MPCSPHMPRRRVPALVASLLLAALAGCTTERTPAEPALATLTGRAVLPADTFAPGPPVGHALAGEINDREPPFASPPVQGFSSLLRLADGDWLALQDNGFGTQANSRDYPLRWYRLGVDLDTRAVVVRGVVDIRDPDRLLPFPLTAPDSLGRLTGGDLDPESFVQMPDGSFWIGEEFGPSLVPVTADGVVRQKPVEVPIVPLLRDYARGSPFYRTPDHPELRAMSQEETREELANQPRSGGIEGLARNPSGSRLYVAVEKGLRDDPVGARRVILEFDPAYRSFTGNSWLYRADGPDISLASLEAVDNRVLLVVERDLEEGRDAAVKRIYRVELGRVDPDGYLQKTLVCDLLNIDDTEGLTRSERGAFGLGRHYAFPYVTPESLVVLDPGTIVLVNDNNYPFSAGRRRGAPDDNEFVRLRLHVPLDTRPGAGTQVAGD